MKRLAILGSTGSIGRQTLDVVRSFPGRFQVVGLAAGLNRKLLEQQIAEFRPRFACLQSDQTGSISGARCLPMAEMASHSDVDLVVLATSGRAGLAPALAAIESGKKLALANKEVLVMAGEVVMARACQRGVDIVPIDSEHSAIWQCLQGEPRQAVRKILLTASGGPFRRHDRNELQAITAEEALRHPTWSMGKKVTIDSATLMNKGMEIIEAHWLFGVDYQQIEVVVHPQSIVHSLVEFADGSVKAQLSPPDMRLPIQYALSHPERLSNPALPQLDLARTASLSFEAPDAERFPCLRLARHAGEKGGTYPAVMSAADDVAVELFLGGAIGFMDIPRLIEGVLEQHQSIGHPSLEAVLEADSWARQTASRIASACS